MMGVIFDFNGTLFFDGEQQERAWRLFAREAFGKEISDGEFRECVHGRNNDFTMQHLAGKALSARQVDEYVEEKETIYRRLCREDPARFHLALGAEELLDELRERGIPRTIATASRRGNVDFISRASAWSGGSTLKSSSTTTAPFSGSRRRTSTCGPPRRSGSSRRTASSSRTRSRGFARQRRRARGR